jgi:putative serine protease PepD
MQPRAPIIRIVVVLAAALVVGAAGAATYAALAPDATKTIVRSVTASSGEPAARTTALTVNEIYSRARRGVVEITTTSTASSPTPFGREEQQAQGSGFVYDTDGHVVTNDHVVDGAESVKIRFWNGSTYDARVVGTDASTDLAVLDVDAPAGVLHPLSLGDASKIEVGDGVVAIGSPFGLEGSLTSGIVSALHREITAPNNFTIDDAIQTDAAINHGNSGGPLLDMHGLVIGVNAQIESESGGNDGVGFAIPATTVRTIVSQLLATGSAEHAYLGVVVETASGGVELREVRRGGPAADAGLRGGDVVRRIEGKRVTTADALRAAINARKPGDSIEMVYSRDGERHTVSVNLGRRPD